MTWATDRGRGLAWAKDRGRGLAAAKDWEVWPGLEVATDRRRGLAATTCLSKQDINCSLLQ